MTRGEPGRLFLCDITRCVTVVYNISSSTKRVTSETWSYHDNSCVRVQRDPGMKAMVSVKLVSQAIAAAVLIAAVAWLSLPDGTIATP